MTTTTPQDVPIPAGSVLVHDWDDRDTTTPTRYFVGSSWEIKRADRSMRVLIDGTRHASGHVERVISLDDDNLTLEQARQLAAALSNAVDDAELMGSYDPLVTAT